MDLFNFISAVFPDPSDGPDFHPDHPTEADGSSDGGGCLIA
jgi:hypothetical protein